jgi:hypothetical protein
VRSDGASGSCWGMGPKELEEFWANIKWAPPPDDIIQMVAICVVLDTVYHGTQREFAENMKYAEQWAKDNGWDFSLGCG